MPARRKKEIVTIKVEAAKPRNPFVQEMTLTKKAKEIPSKKAADYTREALKKDLRKRIEKSGEDD
jgi:hypothetical protein